MEKEKLLQNSSKINENMKTMANKTDIQSRVQSGIAADIQKDAGKYLFGKIWGKKGATYLARVWQKVVSSYFHVSFSLLLVSFFYLHFIHTFSQFDQGHVPPHVPRAPFVSGRQWRLGRCRKENGNEDEALRIPQLSLDEDDCKRR